MGEVIINDHIFGQPLGSPMDSHFLQQGVSDLINSHSKAPDFGSSETNGKRPLILPQGFVEGFMNTHSEAPNTIMAEFTKNRPATCGDGAFAPDIYSDYKRPSMVDRPLQATPGVTASSKTPELSLHLSGGEVLSLCGSKQSLDTKDGSHLTVENGKWSLKDKNGKEVEALPQYDKVLRAPQWYDLSNGGTVEYDNGQTRLHYGGNTVTFDQKGITKFGRDSKEDLLR